MALRTSLVAQPHLYMGDVTGKPLDYGMVYFGEPDKDPEYYPIDIYYDVTLTTAAAQPVRTKGGFLNANGNMTEVYAAEIEYSVKVLDSYGRQVFYQERMSTASSGSSVSTRLPYPDAITRTMDEKASDTVSVMDFGGIGDGVVNDTAAFDLLELNITGRVVDLQGKTYKVDQVPTKNKYINGSFSVGSELILSSGDLKDITKQAPLISNQNIDTHSLRYSLIRRGPTGGIYSTPQGVAYDSKNERLYQCTTGTIDGRGYSLNVFEATTTGELTDYYYNRSVSFGHQGIGVHYDSTTGDPIIWMSGNYNYTANTGNLATAYSAVRMSNADSITDGITTFKLFADTSSTQSVTPNISSCGRFLVAKFVTGTNARVRLFDVKRMWDNRATVTDYSKNYLYEFDVEKPSSVDLQGLACDGVYIYVLLAEYGFSENAYIHILTLQGETVDKVNIVNVGLADAIADSPNPELKDGLKEYEGLLVFNEAGKQSLGIVVATTYGKDNGKKNCYIYEIGSAVTTVNLKGGSVTTGRGLLHSASPRGENYNFGVLDATLGYSTYWTVHPTRKGILTSNGNPIFWANGLTAGVQAVSNGPEGASNILLARTDNIAEGPRLIMHKSRSGSTNPSDFVSMDKARMGKIEFTGDTGEGHVLGALITANGYVTNSIIESDISLQVHRSNGDAVDYFFKNTGITLGENGFLNLADATNRFNNSYFTVAPNVSSDERVKQQARPLGEREKMAALEIKDNISLYKINAAVDLKGDSARWHTGVMAQKVHNILESHDLEPFDYAFLCFDEWEAQDAVIDDDGNEVQAAREAGDSYSIRYDELAMFILAAI